MNDTIIQLESKNGTQGRARLWLIIIQLFGVLLLIPWLFPFAYFFLRGGFSISENLQMLFTPLQVDYVGKFFWIMVSTYLMLLYPLLVIIFFTIAWILYAKRQYVWAVITTIVPIFLLILTMMNGWS